MKKYFLAVDIGASSGRHILGTLENGKIKLDEIYRFPNGMENIDGSFCWNTDALFYEIKQGLKKCRELGKIPVCMGIDTWAVDYVLLDENDCPIGKSYGYRDSRMQGMDTKVYEEISLKELYQRTGIQKQIFNTIYQLTADKEKEPERLDQAKSLLMIPDYFNFLLTGVKKTEYTNATTTQLVDPETKDWDSSLIKRLGFPEEIFQEIAVPGTFVGNFTEEIQEEIGFDCQVVLPATHDTGSAVAAIPTEDDQALYISSGTWSLMGTELKKADCSLESMKANLTNEGGVDYRFRYLKNIMGLWMIQSVKKEFDTEYSFSYLCEMASKQAIPSIVDCNDESFLAPDSMIKAVKDYCIKTSQQVPKSEWETAAVIYHSLAECYAKTIREIESLTGKTYEKIYVVGGGANAGYLNELTAKYTGCTVYAGPSEATAIGSLLTQMRYAGCFKNLQEARRCVAQSFEIEIYKPENIGGKAS